MRLERHAAWLTGLIWSTLALAGTPEKPKPSFTAAEMAVLQRNDLLARAIGPDPWLVRHWMDRIEARSPAAEGGSAPDGFDARKNPDLSAAGRGSADGTYDLIQLIKKAAPQPIKKP